ncbi:hypothetical protein [Rasiella sp. SM2506]|uniref:hypothetical protein n=1 Tax=Rasiella sp. SM2506 TaxID=3423914 RepID=UPI003D7B9EB3
MKKILFLLAITVSVAACKNETAKTSNDPQYEGEFIYVADGAVLKGDTFIYGITLDEMATELQEKVAPIKKDDYDMVPVIVKGTLANKTEGTEGWDEVLTITEIVSVSDTPSEADIKLVDKKEADSSN